MDADNSSAPLADIFAANTPGANQSESSSVSSGELLPESQQDSSSSLEKQHQLLKKKLAQQPDEYTSPTDQVMTPCSKKLQDYKKKAFNVKRRPTSLASRIGEAMGDKDQIKANEKPTELFGEPSNEEDGSILELWPMFYTCK